MQKEIILTGDGSATIKVPALNVCYHSVHGAVQESIHVYLNAGLHSALEKFPNEPLQIFEMGFGTGLNALLTAIEAEKINRDIIYTAVETVPITNDEVEQLNYPAQLGVDEKIFNQLHTAPWKKDAVINSNFILHKTNVSLLEYSTDKHFHLIYYDAFAPAAQPELWSEIVFKKLFHLLHTGGILVTYCAKGAVRRAMQAAGFAIKKLPGPPGKREMLQAIKTMAI